MRILAANLKHFYQCRRVLYVYLALLFALVFFARITVIAHGTGVPFFVGIISLLLGFVTADMPRGILAKPFSFCMPIHRYIPRRIIFLVGIGVNMVIAIAFLVGLEPGAQNSTSITSAAFSAGMVSYLLGACANLAPHRFPYDLLVFLACAVILIVEWFGYGSQLIIEYPLWVIVSGLPLCAIAWKFLGRSSLARDHCGRIFFGFSRNVSKIRKLQQNQSTQRTLEKGEALYEQVEKFFLPRMKACRPFSRNRFVLGNLYIIFCKYSGFTAKWKMAVISLIPLPLIIPFGCIAPGELAPLLLLVGILLAAGINLLPHRSMLLPLGRAEKWYGVVVSGLAVTATPIMYVLILSIISIILSMILPAFPMATEHYPFHPINLNKIYIYLFLMPVALTAGTLSPRRPLVIGDILTGVVIIVAIGITLAGIAGLLSPSLLGGIPGIIILIAASWIGFVLIMRHHFLKRDLVSQGG